jgi:hypothetical protein
MAMGNRPEKTAMYLEYLEMREMGLIGWTGVKAAFASFSRSIVDCKVFQEGRGVRS